MIAAVGCLLIALACQDVERVVGPATNPPKPDVVATPPVLLSLTCTLDRKSTAISCKPVIPSPAAGVSANVIYGATATYAIFFPYNLVKDTVAHTWAFTAYLQNLLKQSVGTLNGTTVTGVKVFVTDFHATTGTGTVSVANADGIGNFTAPNQPYFNYNQIVTPNGYTSNKLWKFNVPNTVTAVSTSILISTDFPAEQNVSSVPPTTVPAWVHADSNISAPTDSVHVTFVKRVLMVRFQPTATLADRQLAVAYVNGVVVGGRVDGGGADGLYYVRVPDNGSGGPLLHSSMILSKLPQVQMAVPEVLDAPDELKPNNGGDWSNWTLSPDTVNISKTNWAPEMINAPYGWGCSTGDPSVAVGIVDRGFRLPADLQANAPASYFGYSVSDPGAHFHGTKIASIIAANGNSTGGMTGTMWRASLQFEDMTRDSLGTSAMSPGPGSVALAVARLAQRGIRIVNISSGTSWDPAYTPHTANDSALATATAQIFLSTLRYARTKGYTAPLPLLVFSAGNYPSSNADAFYSGYPQLHDSLPDSILTVGAMSKTRALSSFSARGDPQRSVG